MSPIHDQEISKLIAAARKLLGLIEDVLDYSSLDASVPLGESPIDVASMNARRSARLTLRA